MGEVTEVIEGAGDEMPAKLISMYLKKSLIYKTKAIHNLLLSNYADLFTSKAFQQIL